MTAEKGAAGAGPSAPEPAPEGRGLDPNEEFPNQPDGWLMLWCPACLYSVVWTEAEWITYSEAEWRVLLEEAATHDH